MIKINAPWGTLNPFERDEIGFKSDFGTNYNVMQLAVESITLANEDREQIYNWIYQGQGRFEMIPITIEAETITENYYLDLATCNWTDSTVSVTVKPRLGADWFWEQADNLTFDAIQKFHGTLIPNTINIPYLVVKPDIALQSLILAVTTYSLVTEITRTAKAVADLIADGLDIVGTGAFTAIAKAVALIAYLASMLISLISLIIQLVKLFFPRLRNFKAMRDVDLIALGCQALGFSLDSTLLSSLQNLVTLPVPMTRELNRDSFFEKIADELTNAVFNYGYPTASDTTPTLGGFIREFMRIYNAESIAYNGVLKIETRSWFQQNTNTNLDLYFNDQEAREQNWKFDTEEDWKRKILYWQTDYQDLHTADNFFNVASELNTAPISVLNPDLVKIQGFKDEAFMFSLGARKKGLNFIEKSAKLLLNIADALVSVFGGNGNFASNVTDRNGVLIISEETFSITKKLWISNGRQPDNYKEFLGITYIYAQFHRDLELNVNSGVIYENMPIPMTEFQFMQISQNKFVNLNGQLVELLTGVFKHEMAEADLTYKVYDNSGQNTQLQLIY